MSYQFRRRDGVVVPFDASRIARAVARAARAVGDPDPDKTGVFIAQFVATSLRTADIVDIEAVQDQVEIALMKTQHYETAQAYTRYRWQRAGVRADARTMVDVQSSVDEYLDRSDWRVQANANQGYSLGGLILNASGKMIANYWLNHVYAPEAGEAHRSGDIHIHDLDMLAGYCAGWSLRTLLAEGLNGVPGKVDAGPPRHFSSAIGQIVNFLGTLQNEWAGAQAFSSFDTYMAPFVRKDRMSYEEVRQYIQELVFNLNVPSRWGTQTPFTNLTFDWTCPEDLREQVPVIGGEEMPFTYGDLKPEMDLINRAYIEVMEAGDAKGRVFTFPIPTYNITQDFDWDSENADRLFAMTAKYGLPYFQNFLNSDLKPNMIRSMCPLAAATRVLVRSPQRGIRIECIGVVYATARKGGAYEVWTPRGWRSAAVIQMPMTDVYRVTLSNGDIVEMGAEHLQPVRGHGILKAQDISPDMWLPYNKAPIEGRAVGTYDIGFLVGAYLGDGSRSEGTVIYSLNSTTKREIAAQLQDIWQRLGYRVVMFEGSHGLGVRVNSGAAEYIARYVGGDDALTKYLKDYAFDTSVAFREGVVAGLQATDGSREKNRLYSSSWPLIESLMTLFASLGRKCRIGCVDDREGRLGSQPNYRLDFMARPRYGDLFDEDDAYHYYRVVSVEKRGPKAGDFLYCFTVQDEDHLFCLANGLVTHNCRLQLDLRELLKRGNGLFGSAEQTGSIGVVTLNAARLGYRHKGDEAALMARVDQLCAIARDSLEVKRKAVQRFMDQGLYPYTKRYLGTLRNHFSTIGVNGVNEMIRNFTEDRDNITTEAGHALAVRLLDRMRDKLTRFQEETGHMYNLEATPAEGTTYRFAREDQKRFPDILQAGTSERPYYTNSSQLPVGFTDDPFEALERQDVLQKKYTGGTVLHLYMAERLSSPQVAKELVRRALGRFHLPYITVTPTFSVCPVHGYLAGEHEFCPRCDEEILARQGHNTDAA